MKLFTILFCCIVLALPVLSEDLVTAEEIAIVTMSGSGEVAFISIENETVIKTVDVNVPYPSFVETTPDGNTAVVVCESGHICFIDTHTMECIKTLELLWGPEQHGITLQPNEFEGMCITPDGLALITEVNEHGQLFIIDTLTMELADTPRNIGDEPTRIVVKSDGSKAYYIEEGSIYYVDLLSSPVSNRLLIYEVLGEEYHEISGFDLVTNRESRAIISDSDNRIYMIDLNQRWSPILDEKLVDPERFTEPVSLKVSPTGTLAIVANGTDPSITFVAIDNDTLTIEETIEVGGPSESVAFTQNGQAAVVTIPQTSQVKIIDVSNRQVRATIGGELGLAPMGVTITTIDVELLENQTPGGSTRD